MEFSSLSFIFWLIGFFHCFLTEQPVKPTVRVDQNSVYTGDSVTLTCDLQPATGWREFYWYRDDQKTVTTSSNTYSVELYFSGIKKFRCSARGENNHDTELSDEVQVTVSNRPRPIVMVNPDSDLLVGETVKLVCFIQGAKVSEWQYSWYKDDSDAIISTDRVYIISNFTETHSGEYTCRGSGDLGPSHISDAVTLTVSVKATLTVNQNSAYTGDSITLTCDLQPASGWKLFFWYRNDQRHTTSYSNTRCLKLSKSGEINFRCAAHGGNNYYVHQSDGVLVTVSKKPKPTVMINPGDEVLKGEPVKLTCNIQDNKVSEWQYSWYKDGSDAVISTDQVYTISHVTDIHSGKYTCRGSDDRGSSHISDAVTLTVSAKTSSSV